MVVDNLVKTAPGGAVASGVLKQATKYVDVRIDPPVFQPFAPPYPRLPPPPRINPPHPALLYCRPQGKNKDMARHSSEVRATAGVEKHKEKKSVMQRASSTTEPGASSGGLTTIELPVASATATFFVAISSG